MLFNPKIYEFEIDGRKCSFETGKLALKSQSAIIARMGDTVVEVNVNTAPANPDSDFFPMSVEYIERFYASGKISGSRFVKIERFPSDDAVLKARMIDRALRCRFPHDYRDELSLIASSNENLILYLISSPLETLCLLVVCSPNPKSNPKSLPPKNVLNISPISKGAPP